MIFFDEVNFFSGNTDIFRQNYCLIDLAGNAEYIRPDPIFVACFSHKIWLIVQVPVICSSNCYRTY